MFFFSYFVLDGSKKKLIAVKKQGVSKYGNNGPYSQKTFKDKNIPCDLKRILANTANHAVTKKSWGNYKTANNLLELCQKETNYDLSLPLCEIKTLIFVSWCIKRNNKSSTIKVYLAGLRALHIEKGLLVTNLYSPLVSQVIKGRENMLISNNHNIRLPCTLSILRLLKTKLRNSKLLTDIQITIWCISTLAFYGAFRMGELLCKSTKEYDPNYSLTKKDISISKTKERLVF